MRIISIDLGWQLHGNVLKRKLLMLLSISFFLVFFFLYNEKDKYDHIASIQSSNRFCQAMKFERSDGNILLLLLILQSRTIVWIGIYNLTYVLYIYICMCVYVWMICLGFFSLFGVKYESWLVKSISDFYRKW